MPEGLVLQASLPCPLVQLEGFSTQYRPFSMQRKTAVIAAAVLVCLLEPERIIVEDDEDDIENPADGTTKENPENR